jgi:hypothetical protein
VVQHKSTAVLVLDHKRGTADWRRHVQAFCEALHERRLAGAERAFEQESVAGHSSPTQSPTKCAHFLRGGNRQFDGAHTFEV